MVKWLWVVKITKVNNLTGKNLIKISWIKSWTKVNVYSLLELVKLKKGDSVCLKKKLHPQKLLSVTIVT
jgi:hypothetical protein